MAEKGKTKLSQPAKNIPKDGQVIMAIMKEMGITEYEPKTIIQLTEFVYRYATSILEEARTFANNCKKKFIDVEDVRLALSLTNESSFTMPPPREVLLDCARNKNNTPLPLIKPHCGLRLPPDRHCLSACNYILKTATQKKIKTPGVSGIKIVNKPMVSYIKRTNTAPLNKQTVTIPKPTTNIANQQKTILKPKIQIQQSMQVVRIASPAVASALVSGFSERACYYVDSASFLFSAAMLLTSENPTRCHCSKPAKRSAPKRDVPSWWATRATTPKPPTP